MRTVTRPRPARPALLALALVPLALSACMVVPVAQGYGRVGPGRASVRVVAPVPVVPVVVPPQVVVAPEVYWRAPVYLPAPVYAAPRGRYHLHPYPARPVIMRSVEPSPYGVRDRTDTPRTQPYPGPYVAPSPYGRR